MKTNQKIILFIFIIAATTLIANCQGSDQNISEIPKLILSETDSKNQKLEKAANWLQALQKRELFNGGVLLIKNDSIMFEQTSGYTDFTRSKRLDSHSTFRLASISKQFTAVGIMLLKDQWKLEFDDPITKYLPTLKYQESSIRNLLNHTSGIPDACMGFADTYQDEIGSELEIHEVLKLLTKANLPYVSKPNEKFWYNNTGYVLLAAIVESITGESFESFMNRELFAKLEMKDSRVWNLATKNLEFKNKTKSFQIQNGKVTELPPGIFDGISGDGGIFCSLYDFVIWNQFWSKNNLINKKTMTESFRKSTFNNGKENSYAFGWNIANNGVAWHNGSWLGARTLIARNENLQNCMLILDNSASTQIDFIG